MRCTLLIYGNVALKSHFSKGWHKTLIILAGSNIGSSGKAVFRFISKGAFSKLGSVTHSIFKAQLFKKHK